MYKSTISSQFSYSYVNSPQGNPLKRDAACQHGAPPKAEQLPQALDSIKHAGSSDMGPSTQRIQRGRLQHDPAHVAHQHKLGLKMYQVAVQQSDLNSSFLEF